MAVSSSRVWRAWVARSQRALLGVHVGDEGVELGAVRRADLRREVLPGGEKIVFLRGRDGVKLQLSRV